LKQPQYNPMSVEEQVFLLFAGTRGYLDSVPVNHVGKYEASLIDAMRANAKNILQKIREEKEIKSETEKEMISFLETFTKGFLMASDKKAA
jgi:F-type H+-transporting ATPase subunit alpha